MIKIIIMLLAGAFIIVADSSTVYLLHGFNYVKSLKFEQAIPHFSKAILFDSNLEVAYYNRGTCYLYLESYEKAIDDFNFAIMLNPSNVDAFYNKSKAYFSLDDIDKSIIWIDSLLKIDSLYFKGYVAKGDCLRKLDKNDLAILSYTRALNISPQYPIALAKRAETYESEGEFERAFLDYRNSLLNNLRFGDVYCSYAELLLRLGKEEMYAEGIRFLTKSLKTDPHANLHLLRGQLYLKVRKTESAKRDFRTYIAHSHKPFLKSLRDLLGSFQ